MSSDVENLVSDVLDNLSDDFKEKLKNWGKIVQIRINNDLYYIDFNKNFELISGSHESSDFTISSSLQTFSGIINGSLNPVDAVVSGEVSIDGSLTSALEFSELVQNAQT